MDTLKRATGVRLALHTSGPLLDWLEEEERGFLDDIRNLADAGVLEIMGGAFYEPIITSIPERDARQQIIYMREYIKKRFGQDPEGAWLAERVWEPDIPRILSSAGVRYTLVDDTHFLYAGLDAEEIKGYFMTEKEGCCLAVFPISKELRYLIPFAPRPEDVIEWLSSVAEKRPGIALTYGDDGEKFGVWPGTYEHVYTGGWLSRFFTLVAENSDWLQMMSPADYVKEFAPAGRIYLPAASYEEMMEWALPVVSGRRYRQLLEELESRGDLDKLRPFFRGGFWSNFFVKYPESNLMRARMMSVSERLERLGLSYRPRRGGPSQQTEERPHPATAHLWKGQCNCSYWHGLFGGIYLNHLRHAVYENLVKADIGADEVEEKREGYRPSVQITDIDCDGEEEIVIGTRSLHVLVVPHAGGSVAEIDYKDAAFNVTNVLARREEAYHDITGVNTTREKGAPADGIASIHELKKGLPQDLEGVFPYDEYPRFSFHDHFLAAGSDVDAARCVRESDLGDFADREYQIAQQPHIEAGIISFILERAAGINGANGHEEMNLEKSFQIMIDRPVLLVKYKLLRRKASISDLIFAVELNLSLLAASSDDRYYRFVDGESVRRNFAESVLVGGSRGAILVDEYSGFVVRIEAWPASDKAWHQPVFTLSQTEKDYEKTYQGSAFVFGWRVAAGVKEAEVSLALSFENMDRKSDWEEE